jgi:cell division protein FtsA
MATSAHAGSGTRHIAGVLDVGSFKTACLIAAVSPGSQTPVRIAGVGHVPSRGVKSGVVVDIAEAERSIRSAIAQAERMAGVRLSEIAVSTTCGRMMSQRFTASAPVHLGAVQPQELSKLQSGARSYAERDGRRLVHLNPIAYRLDGVTGTDEPLGMAGQKVGATFHAVTADDGPLRNLLYVIERCYLSPQPLLPAAYAAALAATTGEEQKLGVLVIDMGGGTTSLAAFQDGRYIFTDTIPVGGSHVTLDIARALQTPPEEAERIKALYGTVISAQSNAHETFSYPQAGDEGAQPLQMSKAQLADLIRPRLENLMTLAAQRLQQNGVWQGAAVPVVVTGGASQLPGTLELASHILKQPVRAGRPGTLSGLPPLMSAPAFSAVAGALLSRVEDRSLPIASDGGTHAGQGYLSRVGHWLKDGF